jgi:hypothetical protein
VHPISGFALGSRIRKSTITSISVFNTALDAILSHHAIWAMSLLVLICIVGMATIQTAAVKAKTDPVWFALVVIIVAVVAVVTVVVAVVTVVVAVVTVVTGVVPVVTVVVAVVTVVIGI